MQADVLDSMLDRIKIRSSIFACMTLRAPWGFAKPRLQGSPFYVVTSGHCVVRIDGDDAVEAREGDVIILPRGDAHDLLDDVSSPLVPFKRVIAELGWAVWTPGMRYKTGALRYGSADGLLTQLVAGVFDFEDFQRNPLLSDLPRILHLRTADAQTDRNGFASIVRMLTALVSVRASGSGSVAGRLADLLFIEAVRCHLSSTRQDGSGWLLGLHDPQLGRAIALIHAEPGQAWTVAGLGEAVGMSRAAFANRFRAVIGRSPIEYLTDWRMYIASLELMTKGKTLAAVAHTCGYRSEIAFSRAFRRWSGVLPHDYRQLHPSWPDEKHADAAPDVSAQSGR